MSYQNNEIVSESDKINIDFYNINSSVYSRKKNEKKEILKGLSGRFSSGKMCAILGPSGAGKSSLLNILSGFKSANDDGEILINGQFCSVGEFRMKSCYILQDISLHPKLTTLETLKVAADLKLPPSVSTEEKMLIVLNVMHTLGLEASSNTRVDHLSGGECKRLSIGLEILTNPPVMFLDEPTSGLDSVSAVQVVSHLRDLSRTGRNVVCVIHQPSSRILEFFDDIYVMSHGQCIYNGALANMVDVFKDSGFECPQFYNRADFAMEIASGERPGCLDALIEKTKKRIRIGNIKDDKRNANDEFSEQSKMLHKPQRFSANVKTYQTSQWKQFCVLLKRSFLCISREIIVTRLKIITHLCVGLLIGGIFYDIGNNAAKVSANVSLLFFILLFVYFANCITFVLLYPMEANIFYREYLNNWYSFLPYVYSKILAELPCLLISTIATLIPVYYLTNQPMELNRFLLLTLIYILTTVIALFSGLAFGAQFGTQMSIFMMPAFMLPLIVFCGFFIHYNELPVVLQPLTYFPFFTYIFRGSIQSIYGYDRPKLECHDVFCYYRSPQKILELMDMEDNTYVTDVLGMVVWIIVFKILFFIALKMKIRKFTQ